MKQKKISKIQIIRHLIQLVAFILFPGLFINIFAAIREIYMAILAGSFQWTAYATQIFLLIAIFPITIIWGRFFCGYLCSFGAMGDLLWAIRSKVSKKTLPISEKADHVAKYIKYVVLVLNILFLWSLAVSFEATWSPWTIFGMYSSIKGWSDLGAFASVGAVLLLLIIVGSLLIERFFCRYLCPLGAIFTLLSHFRLYRIKKPRSECGACQLCTRKCSMGISLKDMDVVQSGECIDCYRCVDVCPRDNVKTNPAPAIAGTTAAVAMTGLYYAGTLASSQIHAQQSDTSVVAEQVEGQTIYEDGTYTGEGTGYHGTTSVEVTVENGLISNITVLSTDDDQEFFNRAKDGVISAIITSQSVDVDTVSGATFSSNGIIEAVENALNVEQTEESQSNSVEESQNAELDLSKIEDGDYTGTGTGFRGETEVIVSVEDHKITSITIESYQDDQQFFERAENTIISEIIDQQKLDVDTVSGATFSSNGIIEAVANALNVSYTNPNSQNESNHYGHGKGNK